MKRLTALFVALAIALAVIVVVVPLPPKWLDAMRLRSPKRFVIIGGGLAGLVAAVELRHRAPFDEVVLIEAQPTVGGRVVSVPLATTGRVENALHCASTGDSGCAEIGATFIHGVERNPLMALARHYKIKTVPIDYDKVAVFDHPAPGAARSTVVPESTVDRVKETIFDAAKKIVFERREQRFRRGGRDTDLATDFRAALRAVATRRQDPTARADNIRATGSIAESLTDEERRVLSWHFYWEIVQDQVAPLDVLSSYSYDASLGFRGPDHIFTDGIGELIDALVSDFLGGSGASAEEAAGLRVRGCSELQSLLASDAAPVRGRRILAVGCPIDRIAAEFGDVAVDEVVSASIAHARRAAVAEAGPNRRITHLPSFDPLASVDAETAPPPSSALTRVADVFSGLWGGGGGRDAAAAVTSIYDVRAAHVTVSGGSGQLRLNANVAIVTVPLGTLAGCDLAASGSQHEALKHSGIAFVPPLPRWKRLSATQLGCAPTLKFAVQFSERFWPDTMHFFGLIGNESGANDDDQKYWAGDANHVEVFNMDHFRRNGVLIFEIESDFAVATSAHVASTNATHAFMEAIGWRLAAAFHDELIATATQSRNATARDILAQRIRGVWANTYILNPFIRCGFSYWTPGSDGDDNLNLRDGLFGDALLFAGEHTTPDMYGNMHGAIAEGQRVAGDALRRVAGSSSTMAGSLEELLYTSRLFGDDGRLPRGRGGFAGHYRASRKRGHFKPAWCPQQCA